MRSRRLPKYLLVLALLAGPAATRAQPPARLAPALAEFKRNFARIEVSQEDEATMALVDRTVRKLVAYLKAHDLSAAEAKRIGLGFTEGATAARLRIYTYSYESGGTRGTVNHPVFQWRNATGRRLAYASGEEGYFGEIHPLTSAGRQRYLLLGGDKGDSQCYAYKAWVVELKGNYLLLDRAAFGKKPLLDLCNVPMTFSRSQQTLRLDLTDYSTSHDEVLLPEWGRPSGKSMTLQFTQGRFVRAH